MGIKEIRVSGARQHNLKNIDVTIPRDSFTVITGLSGSGKSSLAFDTIYAEGQRRYVDSLSVYARQFLDQLEKPDVDSIEGLSPAISIEQKTVSKSPRSTVGTVTEVYDYIRLLFSSIGKPHCYNCGLPITRQSADQIIEAVTELREGERIMIIAPIVRGRKGEFKKELEKLARDGFVRARIDGEIRQLDEEITLDKRKNHSIEVIVDRLLIKPGVRERIADSIKTALKLTSGAVLISVIDGEETLFSEKMACLNCGINIPPIEPRSFSFNSTFGACRHCEGTGTILHIPPEHIVTDDSLPAAKVQFLDGTDRTGASYLRQALYDLIHKYAEDKARNHSQSQKKSSSGNKSKKTSTNGKNNSSSKLKNKLIEELLTTPFAKLPSTIKKEFFFGVKQNGDKQYGPQSRGSLNWPGAVKAIDDRFNDPPSDKVFEALLELSTVIDCPKCGGARLQPASLSVKINSRGIAEYTSVPITKALKLFEEIKLNQREEKIAGLVLREIINRLKFLDTVGLGYLTLNRSSQSLSGGEGQRIRLAAQIGSKLRGVLYVLDEPSIGLHPRDNNKLIETLCELRDLGNTILVVEHDEETIRSADYVVDLGPLAGTHGGEVIATGKPAEITKSDASITGKYLSGQLSIEIPEFRRLPNANKLILRGARGHNLKNVTVEFPLGLFIVVTGVSGSGKSSLITETLYPALSYYLYNSTAWSLEYDSIEGLELIDKVIEIDQSPIGRTPRSNPATYTGLFTPIRDLFAMLPEARQRGYKAGRFSFNVKGGRCEACEGDGLKKIEMSFLPDVYVTCDVCRGKRYNRETLAVKYKDYSIADILDLTIEEALPVLENIPQIKQKLETLIDVGLGYIQLGQSATTLSGGEAQRIKLAKELSKRATGKTIYILDEPTTGLHFADVHKLLDVLQRLVDTGNTVIVIEHNLDVIKSADYIIDLGPEGGEGGGRIIAAGTPEEVARIRRSHTGQALRKIL
jgi:excinuclease ABC subunit A